MPSITDTAGANRLIDHALVQLNCHSDQQLCNRIGITPAMLSQMRMGRRPLGDSMLVRLHLALDTHIFDLFKIMSEPDKK